MRTETQTATKTLERGKIYGFHNSKGYKRVQVFEDMGDGTWVGINQTTNRTIRVSAADVVRVEE